MPKYAASHEFDRRKRDEMFGISAAQSQMNLEKQRYEEAQRQAQQNRPIPQFQSSHRNNNNFDSSRGFEQQGRFPGGQFNTPSNGNGNGMRMGGNAGGNGQYHSGGPNRGAGGGGGNQNGAYNNSAPRQNSNYPLNSNNPSRPTNNFRLPLPGGGGGGPAGSMKLSFSDLNTAGARGATVIPPAPSNRPSTSFQRPIDKPPPPLPY